MMRPGFTRHIQNSGAPLPERTAASLKAMTSGGSTGRPKLIVSKSPGAYDPETVTLEIQNGGVMLVPGRDQVVVKLTNGHNQTAQFSAPVQTITQR